MPKSRETEEGKGGGEAPLHGLLKSAGEKLVPLLVSAGSLIGFVAFAGSVVLWTRFFSLNVPPDQVVDAVPRGEALAIGSAMLLLFGFFGAIATIAVYLIDRGGRATQGMSRAVLLILAVEGSVAIWIVDKPLEDRVIASEVLLLALGGILWVTFVGGLIRLKEVHDFEGDEETQELGDRAFRKSKGKSGVPPRRVLVALATATGLGASAFLATRIAGSDAARAWIVALGVAGLTLVAAVGLRSFNFEREQEEKRQEREAERARQEKLAAARARERSRWRKKMDRWDERLQGRRRKRDERAKNSSGDEEERRKPPGFEFTFRGLLCVTPLILAAVVIPAAILKELWLAASLGSLLVLGMGLWRVASLDKERFIWYGLAVFLSVPLFGTLMLMARNLDNPQVQPIAVIRSTDGPDEALQGLYVTETSDRVYLANIATEGCRQEITAGSGRLLWVSKDEVVAMSIGPLQDVDDAGRAALEMSYALTPSVETPTGTPVNLRVKGSQPPRGERQETEEGRDAAAPIGSDGAAHGEKAGGSARLENAGPAVRPNFGSGVSLIPASASPGDIVTLRMSASNPNGDSGGGFGDSPDGHNLRLNGVRLAILRIRARTASVAEYVKTEAGEVLPLDGEGLTLDSEDHRVIRLAPGSVAEVKDGNRSNGLSLRLDSEGALAPLRVVERAGDRIRIPPKAILRNGEEVALRFGLLRRAWSPSQIKFRVPDDASSGIVTVECKQLAGQPVLQVLRPSTARITVRMQAGSHRVVFDSGHSGEEGGAVQSRQWTIAGRPMGGRAKIMADLPPRLGPYSVQLTVGNVDGQTDSVRLRLLRLPASLFEFGTAEPLDGAAVERATATVLTTVREVRPAAIEVHGHADDVGSDAGNVRLSLRRAVRLRDTLLPPRDTEATVVPAEAGADGAAAMVQAPRVPVTTRAFGETCPIDRRGGRRQANRRVEVFILGRGATVATPEGCRAAKVKQTNW